MAYKKGGGGWRGRGSLSVPDGDHRTEIGESGLGDECEKPRPNPLTQTLVNGGGKGR